MNKIQNIVNQQAPTIHGKSQTSSSSKRRRRAGLWVKTVSRKVSSSPTGFHFGDRVLTLLFVLNTDESSNGGRVDPCGEETHVSDNWSGPSSREGSGTTVREKPTVSHKCGRLRGNGTVHQSSYTICEKPFTHKKNNTSNPRSTTDCSDAQEQNPEVKRSTDAEPNETKLSALYQRVCGAIVTDSEATVLQASVII